MTELRKSHRKNGVRKPFPIPDNLKTQMDATGPPKDRAKIAEMIAEEAKRMDSRVKAAFSYVFGVITAVIFLAVEKEDEFVRKSAAQSFVFSALWLICGLALGWIPFFGPVFSAFLGFCGFLIWIILIVKAIENIYFRLPVIGRFSEKYVMGWFQ